MSRLERHRWNALLKLTGVGKDVSGWFDRLTRAYDEPQRHYHNQQHIAECLVEFDQARHLAQHAAAVELALWFHDAVYDPKAGDNEERSAALARQCLTECGLGESLAETVTRFVLATKHHQVGSDADGAVMVDVDLSILGREEKRFFEYEDAIRREYEWVPLPTYCSKRAEILQCFLDRERIFVTGWFGERYEKQARKNLAASIQKLRRSSQ